MNERFVVDTRDFLVYCQDGAGGNDVMLEFALVSYGISKLQLVLLRSRFNRVLHQHSPLRQRMGRLGTDLRHDQAAVPEHQQMAVAVNVNIQRVFFPLDPPVGADIE
jgi:hypothetical protein